MIRDRLLEYWPFWYPVAAAAGFLVGRWMIRFGERRLARARHSLSEREAALAVRPSPAPIDVEAQR